MQVLIKNQGVMRLAEAEDEGFTRWAVRWQNSRRGMIRKARIVEDVAEWLSNANGLALKLTAIPADLLPSVINKSAGKVEDLLRERFNLKTRWSEKGKLEFYMEAK